MASCSYPQPPRLQTVFAHIQLHANVEIRFNVLDNGRPESTGPSHCKLVDEAYHESKSGVAPVWTPIAIVARKA